MNIQGDYNFLSYSVTSFSFKGTILQPVRGFLPVHVFSFGFESKVEKHEYIDFKWE